MVHTIPDGVWPTMITPFRDDLSIDEAGLEAMIEWYIAAGVHGLFAVCQSSEMFFLKCDERVALARHCVEISGGRVPVIASGHVSEREEEQVDELSAIAGTGIDALVLVVNRLLGADRSDGAWIERLRRLIDRLPPEIALGFYECPYPDNVKLSDGMVAALRESGRFTFIKDTTCSVAAIERKLEILAGSRVKLFNANAATLLPSIRSGASGYSGVMANFHPELYVELWNRRHATDGSADLLAAYLSFSSLIERQYYPLNAHYFMQLSGLPVSVSSRRLDRAGFTEAMRREVEHFHQFDRSIRSRFRQAPHDTP